MEETLKKSAPFSDKKVKLPISDQKKVKIYLVLKG